MSHFDIACGASTRQSCGNGAISALGENAAFDALTFVVLIVGLGATATEFRTGRRIIVVAITAGYVVASELMKSWFYRDLR